MKNSKKMMDIIEKKRELSEEKTPKYGTRKLSVGLVSCMLGFSLIIAPGSSKAAEGSDSAETVKTEVSDKEIPSEEETKVAETPAENVQEQPVEKAEEAQPAEDVQEQPVEKIEEAKEEVAEVKEEFKLTDAQIQRLKEANFTDAEISVVEENIRAYVKENKDFDVDAHIADVIKTKEANEKREAEEKLEVSTDGADKKDGQKAPAGEDRAADPKEDTKKQPAIATRDAAAPEDTATDSDAKDAVHGYVGVLVGGDINADLNAETGQRFKPVEGVKVYFQWYESKGNRTSPTYYATSGADGQFHIKAKPYIGQDGKLVKFDADTTVSAGGESYKMWVDESTIPEGYQLQYSTGEGVEFTDRRVAGGGYNLGPNTLVNYRVLLMEKQDEEKMHKEATPTTPQISKTGQGAVWGKVSWDYESAGGVQWGIVSTPTSPAEGVTVTASYLSDYALKQIYSDKTANMLGLSKPSDIRGSKWTFKLETQLQEWIAEQVAADKENWIAETVSAKTNAEGDYLIQFKGTWGPNWNDESVANYTAPNRWSEEEKARLGTVAEHAEDGTFLAVPPYSNRKHINSNWLFISTKDTDDVVKRTPWNYNWYTGSDNAWGIHGGWAQSAFGVSTKQAAHSTRADFNLAPAEIKFNITNFDTQKNTATPGDVAKTNTQGLPYKNTNDSFKIVWYDQDGNKIKEEPTQKPTSTGALKEATFDTKDVKETKTFIAKLHYVDSKGKLGQVLAQDAFTVKVNDKIGSRYEDVEFSNGETENATYAAKGLPNGLTIDEKTGKVTGKPTEAGKFNVTTTVSIAADDAEAEDVSVDKTDEYIITDSPLEDGEVDSEYNATITPTPIEGYEFDNIRAKFLDGKAIDGLTIEGDKISGTPTAKVEATQKDPNVEVTYDVYQLRKDGTRFLVKKDHVDKVPLVIKDGEAVKYEPSYTAVDGKVGEEATVAAPTFTDKAGNPATPEGVTYEKGEGAPEGAVVNADGSVTYKPVDGDAGKTVEVPVVVKYKDGTTDNATATINVSKKDSETYEPEVKKEEIEKGGKVDLTDNVTNLDKLPKDTKVEDVTPEGAIDTNTPGDYTGKIKVTYPDGSSEEKDVPVTVKDTTPTEKDKDKYEPEVKKEEIEKGGKVDLTDNVTNLDKLPEGTKVEDVTPEGAIDTNKPGDYTGKIKVTYPDGSSEEKDVPVTVKDSTTPTPGEEDKTAPRINRIGDQTVVEGNPIKDVTVKTDDPEAEITVDKLPEGVTFDKDTNTISGTPTVENWGDDEVKEYDVQVTAKDKAGNEDTTEFKITVQRDTDKDGIPDIHDLDDDGDGSSDEEEKEKGTDPKDPKSKPDADPEKDTTAPKIDRIGDQTVVEGNPIKDVEVKTDDDKAKISITGQPDGVSVEGNKISGTPKVSDWGKDEEERDFTVKVTAEDEAGNKSETEFTITVQRDTDGDGTPDIYDKDDDGDGVDDDKEKEKGTDPKDPNSKPDAEPEKDTEAPKIERIGDQTVVEKQPIKEIEVKTDDPEAEITVDGLPNGVTFDKDSKKITGSPEIKDWNDSDKDKPEEVREVTVKVTAKDKDGNESTEEFTITVQRDTDGDGTPDIYDNDDDNDGVSDEDEKKAGTDPKDKDSKPEENKTTVDNSKVKPVDPTDEKQGTGVKVENPDKDTKVTAKDEDGNDVPAVINPETGEVEVTPGKKVDGPITVTVEDPDLPGGKVEVEVPVNGHEKGKDDNGSDKEDKTTVDDSNVKPVDPTDEKQGTGVKVENPDKDTKVTAKDEDGNDVPAEINPETGEVEVTPGENVDGPITVVVEDKDLPEGKVEVEVPVNGHEKGKDDNGSDKTDADKITPALPTEKTGVKDLENLTDKEKEEVKNKIEDANKDKFPEGTNVSVDDKGNATITYPDGSKDTIPAKDLVFQYKHGDPAIEDKPEMPISDIIDPTVPGKTEVDNKDHLTDKEKEDIKNKIEESNKDKFPEGTKVDVDNKGNATITYPDGSKDIIPAEKLVSEKSKASAPVENTDAENNPAVIPGKTEVEDKNNLTEKEKSEISDKVKAVNPKASKIEVANDGSVTITYPDGSTNKIAGKDLVIEKAKDQGTRKAQAKANSDNDLHKVKYVNQSTNVNTGIESQAGIIATLLASVGGLFAGKKRKNKED